MGATHPRDAPLIREMLFEAIGRPGRPPVHHGHHDGDVAQAALKVPRDPATSPTATDLLLDGFATRTAVSYASAVPLLRSAVAALSAAEQAALDGIPATILGWFAADDLWDDEGRRAALEHAEAIQRRHGALGGLDHAGRTDHRRRVGRASGQG